MDDTLAQKTTATNSHVAIDDSGRQMSNGADGAHAWLVKRACAERHHSIIRSWTDGVASCFLGVEMRISNNRPTTVCTRAGYV